MARFTPLKRDVLDSLADEFLAHYPQGRTLIAVDGRGETATFADDLAERLGRGSHPVYRASIDGFHRPRAERYVKGSESAEGFYVDSFDYDLFRRVLIDPFRLAGSAGFVTRAYDQARDSSVLMAWQTAPRDATLIVDGIFLNRPELRALWNYSIWLESPVEPDPARAAGAHALYLAEADPKSRASAIIDNSDPEHPLRTFADSC